MKQLFRSVFYCTALITGLFLQSCGGEDPITVGLSVFDQGYFVLNEGNFGTGNGSISFIGSDTTIERVFQQVNGLPLGDVVQDLAFAGDLAYIVVNNDNKVEVADFSAGMLSVATITALDLPRRIIQVSDEEAYITNWGKFDGSVPAYIAVVDLATQAVSDTITIGAFSGSDHMALAGDYVYVANNFGNTLSVININTQEVEEVIQVGDAPAAMVVDGSSLWVLCSGSYGADFNTPDDDTRAMVYEVATATNTVASTVAIGQLGDHPGKMQGQAGHLLIPNGNNLYKMPTSTLEWPAEPFIAGVSAYGFNVAPSGHIYLGDANGFASAGTIYVYNEAGTLIDQYSSLGVGPNGFFWKQ